LATWPRTSAKILMALLLTWATWASLCLTPINGSRHGCRPIGFGCFIFLACHLLASADLYEKPPQRCTMSMTSTTRFQAANSGDFATYIELMGRVNVPRATRTIETKSLPEDLDPLSAEIMPDAGEELAHKVRRYLKMQDVLVPCSTMRWTGFRAPAACVFQLIQNMISPTQSPSLIGNRTAHRYPMSQLLAKDPRLTTNAKELISLTVYRKSLQVRFPDGSIKLSNSL
jgi:hypothetical protein